MSEIKVNSIKGVGASVAALSINNSDGTCTLASGSKLNNCTTDGTTNLTIADGNLVVGTAGHGIDFSATSDGSGTDTSELLDDYEEGTWTPALNNSGGITVHAATYTKVGRKVTINAYITISANQSSGTLVFTGLPYNEGNLGYHLGAAYTQTTGSIHVFNQIPLQQSYTEVLKNVGNSIFQADVSGGYVLFSNTYFTT